ncbi:MAG: PKD domain-containing protein [Bacteroidetes bacterium]|nr:PKD domain-containing protein [Bacteroidota bacterium]
MKKIGLILLFGLFTAAAYSQSSWTNLSGNSSSSSPADSRAWGQSGGKAFTFRNSDWFRSDTCAYWGFPDTMSGVINGNNTAAPGSACSGMNDLYYSGSLSNQDSGTWVFTGYTSYYYQSSGGTSTLNTSIPVRLTVQVTDTLGNKLSTQHINNTSLYSISDNFIVTVLIEAYSPSNALYMTPGTANTWTPAIDLFNYLYTSPSSSICTSIDMDQFYYVYFSHSISNTGPYCEGDSIRLSASGANSYLWSGPSSFSSTQQNPAHSSGGLSGWQTYSLTMTGAAGCEVLDSTRVFVGLIPGASVDTSSGTTLCSGDSIRLKANNSSGYTLQWLKNGSAISGKTDSILYVSSTGSYAVVFSDTLCSDTSQSVSIQLISRPVSAFVLSGNDSICSGDQVDIAASLGSYDYQWMKNGAAISGATDSTYTVSSGGSYQLIMHQGGLCTDTSSATSITIVSHPGATISASDSSICLGDTIVLHSSGSGINSYSWQKDRAVISGAGADSLEVTASGAYRLVVENAFGCADTTYPITISTIAPPTVSLSLSGDTTFCDYDNVTLSVPNTSGTSYSWYRNGSPIGNSSISATVNLSGIYKVIAFLGVCRDTSREVNVQVNSTTQVNLNITSANLCDGDSVMLASIALGTVSYQWQKDGANIGETGSSIFVQDSSFYHVIVTNNNGCMDTSLNFKAHVYEVPMAGFFVTNDSLCQGGNLFVLNNTSNIGSGSLSYHWDFGDGTSSSSNVPVKSYSSFGAYTIQLIATGPNSCMDTATLPVWVFADPNADFSVDDSMHCQDGNAIQITNNSTLASGTPMFSWNYGDGNSDTGSVGSHRYASPGSYSLQLIVSAPNACADTVQHQISIFAQPQVSFTINDSTQCLNGHEFDFTNTSSISVGSMSYSWYFDDGDSSNQSNPIKSYQGFGNYNVRLIASSGDGCEDSASHKVYVYAEPIAAFSINDTNQCLDSNYYEFSDNSQLGSGSITYEWSFGDGASSNANSPFHHFISDGTYLIQLKTTGPNGCVDSISTNVVVYPEPTASFTLNDTAQCFDGHVFIANNTSSISSGPLTYSWIFGDGSTSVQQSPSHSYAQYGNYALKLVAISSGACVDTASQIVHVYASPTASFSVDDSVQCFQGNQFNFTNVSAISGSDTLRYSWNLGDGNTATSRQLAYSYTNPGNFSVSLISISSNACQDTFTHTMYVPDNPHTNLTVNDSAQCDNIQSFQFQDSTVYPDGYASRLWNFGNGSSDTVENPLVHYSATGLYTVKLVNASQNGCKDSSTRTMRVYEVPNASFSVNRPDMCLFADSFRAYNTSSVNTGTLTYNWDFGDGTSSNKQHVVKAYQADSSWVLRLMAISVNGCIDTASDTLIVFPLPASDFSVSADSQCVNAQDFEFSSLAQLKYGSIIRNSWFMGNSYRDGKKDTTTYFPYAGHKTIRLAVVSDHGCSDTAEKLIRVYDSPVSDFKTNDDVQCLSGNQFTFTPTSTGDSPMNYKWVFGPGDTSTQNSPVKSFGAHDSLDIMLMTYSVYSCVDTTYHSIVILPQPFAAFTVNDSTQCLNTNRFDFEDASTVAYGSISLNWDFSPLNGDISAKPERSYSSPGTYPVKLYAMASGCVDSVIHNMEVFALPDASFAINDASQCVNKQSYQFSANGAGGKDYWFYGDGGSDSLNSNVSHFYTLSGDYLLKHIVLSTEGCFHDTSLGIIVFPKPVAGMVINDSTQCVNAQNFTIASSSVSYGGHPIVAYKWSSDNGQSSIDPYFSPSYASSGQYGVQLIVTNDSNCQDTVISAVRVFPKPDVRFTINDSAQCLNTNAYEFTSASFDSLGIYSQRWFEGKKLYGQDSVLDHSFYDTGIHRIRLRVTSNEGCWDSLGHEIFVKPMPDPDFGPLDPYYCESTTPANVTVNTPGGAFYGKNIWNNQYLPLQLWEDTVTYIVDVNGCVDTSIQYTLVYPTPVADLGPDTIICMNEYLTYDVTFWNSTYLWHDGSTGPLYPAKNTGHYSVTVTNVCGSAHDEVDVEFQDIDCRVMIPTAFTPNNDGTNDYYKPVMDGVLSMNYYIYNRWGQIIYEGTESDSGWDGTKGGVPVQMDVYLVHVVYTFREGTKAVRGENHDVLHLLR